MGRRAQGQVLERRWHHGRTYALRFNAYGQRHYLTLGPDTDGWTGRKAEEHLQAILADARRGLWIPPARRQAAEPAEEKAGPQPTFHRFATDWLTGRKGELRDKGYAYYEWALTHHLLPYFHDWRLSEITIEAVDDYRRHKLAQSHERRQAIERGDPALDRQGQPLRPLSASTINKTLDALQSILGLAVEYGHIASNPAAGKRRRLKRDVRRPVHLDTAGQIHALLDAAGDLDHQPTAQTAGRRALITTLVLAGPRAAEASALLWRDVDLANGRIYIGRSKTTAGLREIPLRPLLRDELAAHKAAQPRIDLDAPVFTTRSGGRRDKDNIRNRVVAPAARRADQLLHERGHPPLPRGVTPHKLRHTFASILVACGEDPTSVMAQLGHADPGFTLRIYTHLMRRDPAERARLKQLVTGDSGPPAVAIDERGVA